MHPYRALIVLIVTLGLGSPSSAQNYQVRARVDLVVVPASVRDGKGKLVYGLTEKDFTIFEDGVPQTITNFSDDPQPLSAAIVVDTGMSGLAMRRLVPLFITITHGFSEFDEMATFRYDHFVFQLSDFSGDREKIEKSFDIVKAIAAKQPAQGNYGGGGPSVPSQVRPDGTPAPATATVPTVGSRRVSPSRVLFDALYEAGTVLKNRASSRRRIVLLISDGEVSGNVNEHSLEEVRDLLLRQNIALYSVNTDTNPLGRRFGTLRSLAQATGGDEYSGLKTSTMEQAFSAITEQARNQYVLGYQSTNEPRNGLITMRTIEVKGRNNGWKITHRKSYQQIP
jgi:VWFA-related protein